MKFRTISSKLALIIAAVLVLGYLFFLNYGSKALNSNPFQKPEEAFLSEVYDKIKENYWEKIPDSDLSQLFGMAAEKLAASGSAKPETRQTKPASKKEVLDLINSIDKNYDKDKKREFLVNVASVVLANLKPFGRSGLYTQKLETQLKNTVSNINPEKDLYKDLGVPKNASEAAVARAYQKKYDQLSKANTGEARQKLKEVTYAYQTLTDKDNKARYDQNGVEPTIFPKLLTSDIAYLQFKKFSPTSLDEFQKGLGSFDTTSGPSALIFDLRGNIGGAIDATSYFLGNMIGLNQYAFDFYHQGDFKPFKTNLDLLPVMKKFRQIVILVDNQTQSSAELMAASLKKYHMGIVVGVPTKGWGTVEKVFPLDHQITTGEKYSVFLVHSLTLRDDNQPIEGRGVEPNVNTNDANWESKLSSYVRYPQLVYAVKQILNQPR